LKRTHSFRFSVNREPTSGVKYTVPNLVDGKVYEFRVSAENLYGQSVPLKCEKPIIAKNPFSMLSIK
jgi:hypothetical protein